MTFFSPFFFPQRRRRERKKDALLPVLHKASFLISSPNLFSGSCLARGHVARWEPRQGKHRRDAATGPGAWLTTLRTSTAITGTTVRVYCPLMMTSLSFPQGIQQYKKWAIMQAWHSCLGESHYIKCCLLLLKLQLRSPAGNGAIIMKAFDHISRGRKDCWWYKK